MVESTSQAGRQLHLCCCSMAISPWGPLPLITLETMRLMMRASQENVYIDISKNFRCICHLPSSGVAPTPGSPMLGCAIALTSWDCRWRGSWRMSVVQIVISSQDSYGPAIVSRWGGSINEAKLHDIWCQHAFRSFMGEVARIPWHVGSTTRAALIENLTRAAMILAFKQRAPKPKPLWISDSTWHIIKTRRECGALARRAAQLARDAHDAIPQALSQTNAGWLEQVVEQTRQISGMASVSASFSKRSCIGQSRRTAELMCNKL
jgi:hypothetical protein